MLHKWQNVHVQLHILNIQTVMLTVSFFTNTTHIHSSCCLTVYCIHTTTYTTYIQKEKMMTWNICATSMLITSTYTSPSDTTLLAIWAVIGVDSDVGQWKIMSEEVDGRISSQFNIVDTYQLLSLYLFHISHCYVCISVVYLCYSSLFACIVYCVLFVRLTVWCSTY